MFIAYPCVFKELPDGTWRGDFPDLEGCYADGPCFNDAIEDAIEQVRLWVRARLEEDDDVNLPGVTDIELMKPAEGEVIRMIGATVYTTDSPY